MLQAEQGKTIGLVKMKQLTVGLQFGRQAYREVIFFEDKATLERFKTNEFEFIAQTSATAINAEDHKDATYKDGVLVYIQKIAALCTTHLLVDKNLITILFSSDGEKRTGCLKILRQPVFFIQTT